MSITGIQKPLFHRRPCTCLRICEHKQCSFHWPSFFGSFPFAAVQVKGFGAIEGAQTPQSPLAKCSTSSPLASLMETIPRPPKVDELLQRSWPFAGLIAYTGIQLGIHCHRTSGSVWTLDPPMKYIKKCLQSPSSQKVSGRPPRSADRRLGTDAKNDSPRNRNSRREVT